MPSMKYHGDRDRATSERHFEGSRSFGHGLRHSSREGGGGKHHRSQSRAGATTTSNSQQRQDRHRRRSGSPPSLRDRGSRSGSVKGIVSQRRRSQSPPPQALRKRVTEPSSSARHHSNNHRSSPPRHRSSISARPHHNGNDERRDRRREGGSRHEVRERPPPPRPPPSRGAHKTTSTVSSSSSSGPRASSNSSRSQTTSVLSMPPRDKPGAANVRNGAVGGRDRRLESNSEAGPSSSRSRQTPPRGTPMVNGCGPPVTAGPSRAPRGVPPRVDKTGALHRPKARPNSVLTSPRKAHRMTAAAGGSRPHQQTPRHHPMPPASGSLRPFLRRARPLVNNTKGPPPSFAGRSSRGGSVKRKMSSPRLHSPPPFKKLMNHRHEPETPKLPSATTSKVSLLDELNDNTADDFDELSAVDKWIRSAPDELYYTRQADGFTTATERTKVLCDKFEETLVLKAKAAREEAEALGVEKMSELIIIENAQLEEQRRLKKEKKAHKAQCSSKHHHHPPHSSVSSSSSSSCSTSETNHRDQSKSDSSKDSKETSCSGEESTQKRPPSPEITVTVVDVEVEEGELIEDDVDDGETTVVQKSEKPPATNEAVPATKTDGGGKVGSSSESSCDERGETNERKHTASKNKTNPHKKVKPTKDRGKKKVKEEVQESSSTDDESSGSEDDDDSSSSDDDDDSTGCGFGMTRSDTANRELERRKKHPRRLHVELWHNDPGLMNDGPVCRCSAKARRFGIRHGFYPGEDRIVGCDHFTNNKDRLFHYRITISPPKNFLISTPTVINHDGHEYIFEGFSIFAHHQLDLNLPPCKVIRFNIRYDVFIEEERFPESFCVRELLLFETYLFREILELVDLKYEWSTTMTAEGEDGGCSQFHLMPRFVRQLPDNGQEILSMNRVLIHLLRSDRELVREEDLAKLYTVEQSEWQNFADRHKGTIVTKWGMKPCAVRVDQIDRDVSGQDLVEENGIPFPLIVHFGIRPPQLSYAGNAGYQKAWRRYVKYRHLLSNMPKPSQEDKSKLLEKEMSLQAMRTATNMKRDVTVAISSRGFRTSGICCDLVQHAMLIPVLVAHLRFHKCLQTLEKGMAYTFENRNLLQLAMTHPSYRENFGTNPDHARNALTNCGIRQPEYGDRRIHYASTRKRGINTLINIMAKFGADQETESDITHNERLEFLGDAVVEFVTSIHLFHIFPDLEEGGLATYRAAIVQNQHLAVLAQALNLDQYMLYAHGSDLCHDSELRHAMANCFEALMGALFLDGGIEAADRVFGGTLFGTNDRLLAVWVSYPKHPLQQEEPQGDRAWIDSHDVLKKLTTFEDSIGVRFQHIRLLARAFTDRSLGYNNLTRGSNQRLEFLGDTVLQLISSEHLYRHFPDHHEGHLSLLRSSLVNNRTQSIVCDILGMPAYAMRGDPKSEMKTKDRADLLEAFLGALYIDRGLHHCSVFCKVCFFPRLTCSITKQEWNDPKSKLQQCCLTLRAMDGREPDIPVYKVTNSLGPTNTRTYIVAVYFRGSRLATAQGHSIQEAEMNAAALALEISGHLFPQLHHQKRIMDKTKKPH